MNLDTEPDIYTLCSIIIKDIENIHKYQKNKNYKKALSIIRKFRNPPRIEYSNEEQVIIPDVMIFVNDDKHFTISLNDSYYPSLNINIDECDKNNSFIKEKIKEGNDLIHALNMRKSTLMKVANLIAVNQYDFFLGGSIKPMKLKDIATDLEYNPSTISRTISNKYIICNRGIFSIKSFFTTSLDEESDISNSSIKIYINQLIKNENRQKPYSDEKLREKIKEKFNINIVRRTVTKYRKQLNIGSSTERKKYLFL
jgi:RNA polymerase sigma-54 factor